MVVRVKQGHVCNLLKIVPGKRVRVTAVSTVTESLGPGPHRAWSPEGKHPLGILWKTRLRLKNIQSEQNSTSPMITSNQKYTNFNSIKQANCLR